MNLDNFERKDKILVEPELEIRDSLTDLLQNSTDII